jgi:C-terminal processing protease CtpA/Prc
MRLIGVAFFVLPWPLRYSRKMRNLSVTVLSVFLILLAGFVVTVKESTGQEAPIDPQERHIIEIVLADVVQDVKSNYYDPKYHGVDLDALFQEAKERVKAAKTYNQALAIVAWVLRKLDDSHTFLIPPRRSHKRVYDYRYEMVGDECYIFAVQPGSDSEKKGLKLGDRILSFNTIVPTHGNLWEINYLFRVLRPQAADELVLQSLDGTQRTLPLSPKMTPEHYGAIGGIDWKDRPPQESPQSSHAVGKSLIIWNFPTFMVNEEAADKLVADSSNYPAMILDLRGNGGGAEQTLLRLVGNVVDHNVTVGTKVMRKANSTLVAKSRGKKAYAGKMIVLVDSRSGSAAEIFARIMQFEHRATVIGDRTVGSVMEASFYPHRFAATSYSAPPDYGAQISHADILMPDGKSLEHMGVMPDIKMVPTGNDLAANRDVVLSYAVSLAGGDLSPEEAGKLFPVQWPKQ